MAAFSDEDMESDNDADMNWLQALKAFPAPRSKLGLKNAYKYEVINDF